MFNMNMQVGIHSLFIFINSYFLLKNYFIYQVSSCIFNVKWYSTWGEPIKKHLIH